MTTMTSVQNWLAVAADRWEDHRAERAALAARATGPWKRCFDLVGACLLLVPSLPVMALIAIAIRLDSRGPILYRQVRVGLNRRRPGGPAAGQQRPGGHDRRRSPGEGRPFEILKFRSMVDGAERTGPRWAVEGDSRVTRVGHLLRATHLDELPQLINVIRGDMSLVGPRPERPYFVRRFAAAIPGYRARLRSRPGITGLAQVENGYDRSPSDVGRKLAHDLRYLQAASPLTDLKLLLRTVAVVTHLRRRP